MVTSREVVWLLAAAPILRYAATAGSKPSAAMTLLVLADQISSEVIAAGEVRAATSASLLGEARWRIGRAVGGARGTDCRLPHQE